MFESISHLHDGSLPPPVSDKTLDEVEFQNATARVSGSHDQASRERDARPDGHAMQRDTGDEQPARSVTNTPRAGESAEATAARHHAPPFRVPPRSLDRTSHQKKLGTVLNEIEKADRAKALPPGSKPNNPKDAFGVLKASITSYCYGPVLMEMAVGMTEGGFKYGAHNYLEAAPRSSVYTDAAERHIAAFVAGQDIDPDSGLSHITKAMCSLHVLRAAQIHGSWIDDRPPPAPEGWLEALNARVVALAQKFPQPVARYLANGKRGPGRILEDV